MSFKMIYLYNERLDRVIYKSKNNYIVSLKYVKKIINESINFDNTNYSFLVVHIIKNNSISRQNKLNLLRYLHSLGIIYSNAKNIDNRSYRQYEILYYIKRNDVEMLNALINVRYLPSVDTYNVINASCDLSPEVTQILLCNKYVKPYDIRCLFNIFNDTYFMLTVIKLYSNDINKIFNRSSIPLLKSIINNNNNSNNNELLIDFILNHGNINTYIIIKCLQYAFIAHKIKYCEMFLNFIYKNPTQFSYSCMNALYFCQKVIEFKDSNLLKCFLKCYLCNKDLNDKMMVNVKPNRYTLPMNRRYMLSSVIKQRWYDGILICSEQLDIKKSYKYYRILKNMELHSIMDLYLPN